MDKLEKKPNGYWTLDRCRKVANSYKIFSRFRVEQVACLSTIRRQGWLDLTDHMYRPRSEWTKNAALSEAALYSSVTEFREGSRGAYRACCKNGWKHGLSRTKKPSGYWTRSRCKKEASKYATRTAFLKGSPDAYAYSVRQDFHADITSHMRRAYAEVKSRPRFVYVMRGTLLGVKLFYVGLTLNVPNRVAAHKRSSRASVRALANSDDLRIWVANRGVSLKEEDASRLEAKLLSKALKGDEVILNVAKAGSLGGRPTYKWTPAAIYAEALLYSNRTAFARGSGSAYGAACKTGVLDEVCQHMQKRS